MVCEKDKFIYNLNNEDEKIESIISTIPSYYKIMNNLI